MQNGWIAAFYALHGIFCIALSMLGKGFFPGRFIGFVVVHIVDYSFRLTRCGRPVSVIRLLQSMTYIIRAKRLGGMEPVRAVAGPCLRYAVPFASGGGDRRDGFDLDVVFLPPSVTSLGDQYV